MENQSKKEQEAEFLKIYVQTGSQKQAASAVGWDKSKSSRFVKKVKETELERLEAIRADLINNSQDPLQAPKLPQEATKRKQAKKDTMKINEAENKENTTLQKQVFSFRAAVIDIAAWRAYATATGQTIENLGTIAMNEYIKRHKLDGTDQVVFEALKEKVLVRIQKDA